VSNYLQNVLKNIKNVKLLKLSKVKQILDKKGFYTPDKKYFNSRFLTQLIDGKKFLLEKNQLQPTSLNCCKSIASTYTINL